MVSGSPVGMEENEVGLRECRALWRAAMDGKVCGIQVRKFEDS